MDLDVFIDEQIAECRSKYEAGEYRQVMQAFRWCAMHGRALPDWIADEACKAFAFYIEKGGAPGKGKTGGHKKKLERAAKDNERYRVAAWQLDRRRIVGGNRRDAFERASEHLTGSFAQGTPEAIEKSYNRVARQYRS